jgi:hypothetical protein
MTDWLISVGTGKNQLPLIRCAKEMGYNVVGLDKNPNKSEVDDYLQISTYEYTEAYKKVLDLPYKSDLKGIFARVSGPAVTMQSFLAERLMLPSTNAKIAEMSVSKCVLREEAVNRKVETILGKSVSTVSSLEPIYPVVVKPNQSLFGKENVYLANNFDELNQGFTKAVTESYDNKVEVQDFIPGEDICFLCVFHLGKIIWYFPYQEHVEMKEGKFSGKGISGPLINFQSENKILNSIERQTFNLCITGFVFFCFRMDNQNCFKLYELNPGLCGDKIADELLPEIWPGFDFFRADIELCVGNLPNFPDKNLVTERVYVET